MPKVMSISVRPLLRIAAWISLQCKVELVFHNGICGLEWKRNLQLVTASACLTMLNMRS